VDSCLTRPVSYTENDLSWNFRVVRTIRPGGSESFQIHEAYYESDIADQFEMDARKRPGSICPEPHQPLGLDLRELHRTLQQMSAALQKPVVDGAGFHIRVRYERKRNKSVAEDMNREVRRADHEAKEWKNQFLKANRDKMQLQKELSALKHGKSE